MSCDPTPNSIIPQTVSPPLELAQRTLALQHRSKSVVPWDGFPRAAVLRRGLAVAERKAHKQSFAHLVVSISQVLKRLLFVVDFLVLGHISLIREIIKVSCVGFRVQLGHKWRLGLSQSLPLHLGKVWVFVDILDVREALGSRVDAPMIVSLMAQCI